MYTFPHHRLWLPYSKCSSFLSLTCQRLPVGPLPQLLHNRCSLRLVLPVGLDTGFQNSSFGLSFSHLSTTEYCELTDELVVLRGWSLGYRAVLPFVDVSPNGRVGIPVIC